MSVTVKTEGFKDLEQTLNTLTKSAGRGVLKRTLISAAEPVAEVARQLAPDDPSTTSEDLHREIFVSSKLSKRDASSHRKMFKDDRSSVEVFVGPSIKAYPQALMQEFGTVNHGPQSYMRPAWDQQQKPTLDRIGGALWQEIEKSMERAARKAARQAAKG